MVWVIRQGKRIVGLGQLYGGEFLCPCRRIVLFFFSCCSRSPSCPSLCYLHWFPSCHFLSPCLDSHLPSGVLRVPHRSILSSRALRAFASSLHALNPSSCQIKSAGTTAANSNKSSFLSILKGPNSWMARNGRFAITVFCGITLADSRLNRQSKYVSLCHQKSVILLPLRTSWHGLFRIGLATTGTENRSRERGPCLPRGHCASPR